MKRRPNKLDAHAGRLAEWEAEGRTLAQMRELLGAEGCRVAVSQLSEYLTRQRGRRMERELLELVAAGGRMSRELEAAYAEAPEPRIEELIRLSKTLIMSLQVQGVAQPRLLSLANAMQQTVLGYLAGRTKAELEHRKIALSESKYRDQVQERVRAIQAEVGKAKAQGGVQSDTMARIEAELKLFP